MTTWAQTLKTRYPARPPEMGFEDYAASLPRQFAGKRPKPKMENLSMSKGNTLRKQQLDTQITPEILAEWDSLHKQGKSFKWIAESSSLGVSDSTVRNRLIEYRARPENQQIRPIQTVAVVQGSTELQEDGFTSQVKRGVESFRREMDALGVNVVSISISLHLVKEVRL